MRQSVVQTPETISKIFEFKKKIRCEKMRKFIVQLWHDLLRRVFEIVVVQLIKSNRTAITFVPQHSLGRSVCRSGEGGASLSENEHDTKASAAN